MAAPSYRGKGDLTQGPVRGHLVRMTVPMIWSILAILSFQLVNTYYISLLGTEALAAISFTFPVTYTVFSLIMGLNIATSSVISRQLGKGNWTRVRRVTTHALLLSFLSGLVIAALGIALMDPVFRLMGADDRMMPLIHDYMLIWFAGSVFINMPMAGNAAIRATGDTLFPALVMIAAALVNVVLDPILIFGLLGAPRMEIQGAAISTVLSNAMALAAGLYVLGAKKKMLARGRRHLRLFGDSAKKLLFIAVPVGVTGIIQPVTAAFITALLAQHGTEAVAAFGIATRVEALAFVIIMALAIGMAPIIGQNWGAGLIGRVNETLRQAFIFAVLWSALVAVILMAFSHPIARAFSDEAPVVHAAVLYFLIVPPTYALGNLVQGWASAFNAMGLPQRAALMIFARLALLTMPLVWLGGALYGVPGIFGAVALANIVSGAGFHLWNRHYCRRKAQAADIPAAIVPAA